MFSGGRPSIEKVEKKAIAAKITRGKAAPDANQRKRTERGIITGIEVAVSWLLGAASILEALSGGRQDVSAKGVHSG
jgi:hypothetical protein